MYISFLVIREAKYYAVFGFLDTYYSENGKRAQ